MGSFNLKSIWKQNGGTGGSTNLEQRVQAIENGYFKKEGGTLQIVRNTTDFYNNVVLKQNGYVDHVDTQAPTSMINKQYLEQQLTATNNQIQTLETNAVKITGDQSIAGVKTFTNTGEAIKINSGTDNSAYVAGYKSNNRRIWYFGKGSSSNDEFVIGSTSNIKLEAANIIHCNSKKLTNVADPAANTDAATKQYVDNRIKFRIVDATINASSTYNVEPTAGYQIINVMVGRKRPSDNFYFFEYPTTLNKQVFYSSDNKIKIYNQGNVNGFSNNEFKIFITEMKV